MIWLFDKDMTFADEIEKENIRSATDILELNKKITAAVTLPFLRFDQADRPVRYFGYRYDHKNYVYRILTTKKSGDDIELTGIHILYDELKGQIVKDKRPTNVLAKAAMEDAVEGTGWQIESTATKVASTNFYYISRLDAMNKVLTTWDCEVDIRIEINHEGVYLKKLILSDRIEKDYGKWYEYGDQLISVVAETGYGDVYTAFVGRGKGEEKEGGGSGRKIRFTDIAWKVASGKPVDKPKGQEYVEIKEATMMYGYPNGKPRVCIVDFDDITDPEELLMETYKHALKNCRPKLQLKAQAYDDEPIELGETCAIIRPDLNIRYKTRIFKLSRNLLSGKRTFEFGDRVAMSQSARIKDQKEETIHRIEVAKNYIIDNLKKLQNDYFGEDGYNYDLKAGNEYDLPAGLYSFDKPIDQNPSKVIYVGAGKMAIANTKTVDGQWVWTTMADGDGMNLDTVNAGTLRTGRVESADGQSYWDLDSNTMVINAASMKINGDPYAKKDDVNSRADMELTQEQLNALNARTEQIEKELEVKVAEGAVRDFKAAYDLFVTKQAEEKEEAERRLQDAANRIVAIEHDMRSKAEQWSFLSKNIMFSEEGIRVGDSGGSSYLLISNNRISMFSAGSEVMHIEEGLLYITHGIFVTSLQIGKFRTEQYHLNADMNVVRYMG